MEHNDSYIILIRYISFSFVSSVTPSDCNFIFQLLYMATHGNLKNAFFYAIVSRTLLYNYSILDISCFFK